MLDLKADLQTRLYGLKCQIPRAPIGFHRDTLRYESSSSFSSSMLSSILVMDLNGIKYLCDPGSRKANL